MQGAPPAGDFRNWDRSDWIKALDANMLAPIELMKSTIDGMIARRFGRIRQYHLACGQGAHRHARTVQRRAFGPHRFRRGGLARATAEHNVTINNLLPGTFDTDRLKSNLQALATNTKRPVEEVTQDIRSSNPSRRFGRTEEFGATCAFLCSAQAGYITGQNILIDGGSYPGTF